MKGTAKQSYRVVRRLITRPIILLDEVILFNFVTLIAGVEVSNSGIRSLAAISDVGLQVLRFMNFASKYIVI